MLCVCQGEGSKDVSLRLVERLDRESVNRYSAVVEALDGGTPQHSASLVVNVVVTDTNDNVPQFDRSPATHLSLLLSNIFIVIIFIYYVLFLFIYFIYY